MSTLSEVRTSKAPPWSRFVAELDNRGLHAVVLFCTIGLFATIAVALRSPALGVILGQF